MTTDLFRAQSALVLEDVAGKYGFAAPDLAREELVVVPLPRGAREGMVALVVTAGLGTVVSVEPELVEWVREHAPADKHFRAMQPFFLAELAEEARRRGFASAQAYGSSLGFALSKRFPNPRLSDRLRLIPVDAEWMARHRDSNVFDNALGEPHETHRIERTLHGFAIVDDGSDPLGVAGTWGEGPIRDEIGVDVRRDARGLGLAKALVGAAIEDILERGRVPFYSCGATNIRSHRNALACGFEPVFLMGMVAER